ncbi:MarR family transcriptional regulator [uncultured Nocardioides sp.]|uniref:MarR family winged helix-turn-helix transcriptional regulator n=1 Tax=uncultured Nocardioides sp. TaxID=198441 RepID=UPI0026303633|nr:MarR family transcriptional regulator [uncultured Nocardioides sp.]
MSVTDADAGLRASREIVEALRLIGPLRREIARLVPDEVGPGGLTALRVISETSAQGGAARVSDIAAAQHVGLPVASRQVRQLEDDGLVAREVSPDDRRAHRLSLTESGRALLTRVHADLIASIDTVLGDWDPADAVTLARLMARLHEGVSRLPDAVPHDPTTHTTPRTLQESAR